MVIYAKISHKMVNQEIVLGKTEEHVIGTLDRRIYYTS